MQSSNSFLSCTDQISHRSLKALQGLPRGAEIIFLACQKAADAERKVHYSAAGAAAAAAAAAAASAARRDEECWKIRLH